MITSAKELKKCYFNFLFSCQEHQLPGGNWSLYMDMNEKPVLFSLSSGIDWIVELFISVMVVHSEITVERVRTLQYKQGSQPNPL